MILKTAWLRLHSDHHHIVEVLIVLYIVNEDLLKCVNTLLHNVEVNSVQNNLLYFHLICTSLLCVCSNAEYTVYKFC